MKPEQYPKANFCCRTEEEAGEAGLAPTRCEMCSSTEAFLLSFFCLIMAVEGEEVDFSASAVVEVVVAEEVVRPSPPRCAIFG